MTNEDRESVLVAAIEAAEELLSFLTHNMGHMHEDGTWEDGNIDITASSAHAQSLADLFQDLEKKLKATKLITPKGSTWH